MFSCSIIREDDNAFAQLNIDSMTGLSNTLCPLCFALISLANHCLDTEKHFSDALSVGHRDGRRMAKRDCTTKY